MVQRMSEVMKFKVGDRVISSPLAVKNFPEEAFVGEVDTVAHVEIIEWDGTFYEEVTLADNGIWDSSWLGFADE